MYNYILHPTINIQVGTDTVTPRDVDILCGRGSICYKHIGDQHLRCIVAMNLPKYANPSTTRKGKGIMIQDIVNQSHNEGRRFLKEGIDGWFILCHKEARYKVGHALRDAASEMKKYLKGYEKKAKSKRTVDTSTKHHIICRSDSEMNESKEESVSNSSQAKIDDNLKSSRWEVQSQVSVLLSPLGKKVNEEVSNDTIISSISTLLSGENDSNIDDKKNDYDFELLFDSISPTFFDANDANVLSSKEGQTPTKYYNHLKDHHVI